MRFASIAWLLLCTGCGAEVASDPEPCEVDDEALDKRWFVGELDTEADNPYFTVTHSVIGIEVEGPTPSAFVDATVQREVRFEVTEDMLVARADDQTKVSLFAITSHRGDRCVRPYMEELGSGPQDLPWQERPWFRVDWGRDLGEPPRFDAATAAGELDAAMYVPLSYHPEGGFEVDTDDGHLSVVVKTWVSWRTLDDGTPGCAYDMPSLAPGAECPDMELTVRCDLTPSP